MPIFFLAIIIYIALFFIVPIPFGFGVVLPASFFWAFYGASLDQQQNKNFLEIIYPLLITYGPILLGSLLFAVSIVFFAVYRTFSKQQNAILRIRLLLLGLGIYFFIQSMLILVQRIFEYYANFHLKAGSHEYLVNIYNRTTSLFLINLVSLVVLIFFIFQAFRKK